MIWVHGALHTRSIHPDHGKAALGLLAVALVVRELREGRQGSPDAPSPGRRFMIPDRNVRIGPVSD